MISGRWPRKRTRNREPPVLLWAVVALVAVFFGLRFGLPWLGLWAGLSRSAVPIPRFALVTYMLCASLGVLLYVSSDDRRWRLFWTPIVRLFVLDTSAGWHVRVVVLASLPMIVGWFVWERVMPSADVPTVIRLQHPTQPASYAALTNPYRKAPSELGDDVKREGLVLYQKNCRPCHGVVASGDGPLARGLRLRPVDFTDPGAIASVVESHPFWRVRTGHTGLPDISTPWNSAMPAWEVELSEDEVWKIVLTEYLLAGTDPRITNEMQR